MSDGKIIFSLSEEDKKNRKELLWINLKKRVSKCTQCALCEHRTKAVFGEGPVDSKLMFVGEGPGGDEDLQGIPFVGRAGQLLDQIFKAAGIPRREIFITNIVKCRPPKNRTPAIEEVLSCQNYLEAQIALINPRLIVCLGNSPTKWFLKTTEGITKLRGRWFNWRGIEVMPIFHPSYLLRNDSRKKGSPKDLTWCDIRRVKKRWEEIVGTDV